MSGKDAKFSFLYFVSSFLYVLMMFSQIKLELQEPCEFNYNKK